MYKEIQFNDRPTNSLPGIISGFQTETIPYLAQALTRGAVLALRINGQLPYGAMLRVDDAKLVKKFWEAKGRVDKYGNIDLTKKPVTSLTDSQRQKFVNWQELDVFGFDPDLIDQVIGLGVHTVLPASDIYPSYLATLANGLKTLSTMQFNEPFFRGLVNNVSALDSNAIIGGTSLNESGQSTFVDSETALIKMGGLSKAVDLFVLTDAPNGVNLENGDRHPMISLETRRSVKVLRTGIGIEKLRVDLTHLGLKVVEGNSP